MRKKLIFVLLSLLMLVGFVACTDPNETGNGNKPSGVDEDVIYSPYVNASIVLGEGVESSDIVPLRNAYFKRVGKEITIRNADSDVAAHEIIIGRTGRDISAKAYRKLEFSHSDEQKVGFCIYSDGKSVAIAFDDAIYGEDIAFTEALEYFITKYMTSSTLKLGEGDSGIVTFYPIDKQRENDAVETERLWELKYSQILAKVSDNETIAKDITEQLKSLYDIYSAKGDPVVWLANLYDPVSGGFYYSNSARNNAGFAADLDSTAQALGLIESLLAGYGGTMTDYLGEEIAAKFVSFAKDMQDENGYFYHPQWSRQLIDETPERKNIDVINALNILEVFGASPRYDTPNGVKGEGVSSISALTFPLLQNTVTAVSKISSSLADQMYIPSYLKSKEAFSEYLATLDISNNTTAVCKQLNSELPLYIAVDEKLEEDGAEYRICELLKDYLDRHQKSNGLWSKASNYSYKEISELNGVLKIYNTIDASVPRFEKIVENILDLLSFKNELQSINDVSDTWTALYLVITNIKSFGYKTSEIVAERCLGSVYGTLAKLVSLTSEQLSLFARGGGSFSTTLTGSASEAYGVSVAIPLTDEGDMSATLLATKNIWYSIFGVIGVGCVPVFNTSDRMMFQKTLLDMGVIIKNEVIKTAAEDFESMDLGVEGPYSIGWRNGGNLTQYTEVVSGGGERGNVLRFYASNESPHIYLMMNSMSNVKSASCYSYEFDLCVNEEYSEGIGASIVLHPSMHVVALERVGDRVRILERSGRYGDAYTYDTAASANVGEWFNLRVEYYTGTAETVRIKIYFNGECVSVSDLYYDKQNVTVVPQNGFEGVSIYNTYKYDVNLLLDNILVESSYKTYEAETANNLSYNVDFTSKKQTVNDFENATEGSTPLGFVVGGTASAATIVSDQNSNKAFSVSEKAGEIILPLDQRGVATNSAVIEFDFTIDPSSAVGTKYQINFNEHLYKERNFGAVQLVVMEENGRKYATIAEVTTAGKIGNIYSNIDISLGVKYTLRLQIFYKEGVIVVFLGNSADDFDVVGININVLKESYKYYMGEATIEAITPTLKSNILIDNLVAERIVSDYETVTSPQVPRKEYTFDDTNDMVLSGVQLSGGELSFAELKNAAYLEIPVNSRVNVPTLSVIKFDVKNIEGVAGEIIVKLIDKRGNVVAAIALIKENGGSVNIHEYTANGRYPTPIYTVNSNAFSITIRYSAQSGGYNMFINDVYATSSSLLYTADGADFKFEKLNISSTASVGLAIDNLYAEEVCSNLITSVTTSSGSDIKNGALTYENNSFVVKPSSVQTSFPTTGPAIYVREGVFESIADGVPKKRVSKVLEYYSDGVASNLILFNRTHSLENANAAFFETDLMIHSNGGSMRTKFEFGGIVNGTYPIIYYVDFTTQGPGKTILLKTNDYEVTLNEKITEGVWFKLRIEYTDTPYDYNYDGYNDCVVRVFINGVQVGEGKTANNPGVVPAAVDMKRIRCGMYYGLEGSVFFDNTILGQCNMEYEAAIPADTDVLYFNPDIVTYQTVFTFGKTTSTAQISKYPTPTDAANKVLEFYTSSGSADKMSVAVTKKDETANAIMFETDIIIEPKSGVATFYLSPQTVKNKYPFKLTIEATKGGNVTISGDGVPKTIIGNSGELIHLKVEYMNPLVDYTGDGIYDILYKIYVGDSSEAVAVGYKAYSSSSYYRPLDLTRYVFESPSESEATIYFDNVKFWQVRLTPDEPEDFGNSNEGTLGGTVGDSHDNNAWT